VIYVDSPVYTHQEALLKTAILPNEIGAHGTTVIAPMDVYLDDDTCQPDVFWVRSDSRCQLRPDGKWAGPPDLVIEILSPSTAVLDRGAKFTLYERHGVRELWLIDILSDQYFVEVYINDERKFDRSGVYVAGDTFDSATLGQTVAVAKIINDSLSAGSIQR
jgi:Uma2 family endonuclease